MTEAARALAIDGMRALREGRTDDAARLIDRARVRVGGRWKTAWRAGAVFTADTTSAGHLLRAQTALASGDGDLAFVELRGLLGSSGSAAE